MKTSPSRAIEPMRSISHPTRASMKTCLTSLPSKTKDSLVNLTKLNSWRVCYHMEKKRSGLRTLRLGSKSHQCIRSSVTVTRPPARTTTRKTKPSSPTRSARWNVPLSQSPTTTIVCRRSQRTTKITIKCKPPTSSSFSTTLTQMRSNFSKRNSLRKPH